MYFFLFYIIFNIVDFWCYCFLNLLQQSHKRCICAKLFYLWKLSATFFLDQFKPFFIFCVYHRNFQSDSLNWLKARPAVRIYLKKFKSWLVYYNYIAKIFYCGDLLPKSAMPKFAYIFCALLCSVGRWFHQGHKNVLVLFS